MHKILLILINSDILGKKKIDLKKRVGREDFCDGGGRKTCK